MSKATHVTILGVDILLSTIAYSTSTVPLNVAIIRDMVEQLRSRSVLPRFFFFKVNDVVLTDLRVVS